MSVRTRRDAFVERLDAEMARLHARRLWVRILVGGVLFGLALGILIGLNVLLRAGGLWGDLGFAVVVTTVVFWVLTQLARPLVGKDKKSARGDRAESRFAESACKRILLACNKLLLIEASGGKLVRTPYAQPPPQRTARPAGDTAPQPWQ